MAIVPLVLLQQVPPSAIPAELRVVGASADIALAGPDAPKSGPPDGGVATTSAQSSGLSAGRALAVAGVGRPSLLTTTTLVTTPATTLAMTTTTTTTTTAVAATTTAAPPATSTPPSTAAATTTVAPTTTAAPTTALPPSTIAPPPPTTEAPPTTQPPATAPTTSAAIAAPTTTAPLPTYANRAEGVASWYGAPAGTCAHVDIPRGTTVKVTRADNGAWTTCVVADWGPADRTRIIDLSDDTFAKLAPLGAGLLNVIIEW